MKVYTVTYGSCPSDAFLVSIWSSRELAEAAAAQYIERTEIEEYELDPTKETP